MTARLINRRQTLSLLATPALMLSLPVLAQVPSTFPPLGLGGALYNKPLSFVLAALGQTASLQICLDAGDAASYDPAVQTDKWLDTSGNGQDFFRGTGTGIDAADPTFNGTAGDLSADEFFSFNGSQFFTYDSANPAWVETLHQNNAIGSSFHWTYFGSVGVTQGLWGTRGSVTAHTGATLFQDNVDDLRFSVQNAGANVLSQARNGGASGVWRFFGWSIDESVGANGGILIFGSNSAGFQSTLFDSTYSSPSASSASFTMQLASRGNGDSPLSNNSRMGMFAMYDRALSVKDFQTIFNATRGRYHL